MRGRGRELPAPGRTEPFSALAEQRGRWAAARPGGCQTAQKRASGWVAGPTPSSGTPFGPGANASVKHDGWSGPCSVFMDRMERGQVWPRGSGAWRRSPSVAPSSPAQALPLRDGVQARLGGGLNQGATSTRGLARRGCRCQGKPCLALRCEDGSAGPHTRPGWPAGTQDALPPPQPSGGALVMPGARGSDHAATCPRWTHTSQGSPQVLLQDALCLPPPT